MACLHMKTKLLEYLDGTLFAEEKAYVEEHLASCEDCSATLDELRKTIKYVGDLDEVEPPPWFAERVMQRVKEETEHKESFFRKLFYPLHIKLPVEAMALVFVAVFAYYAFDVMKPGIEMKEAAQPKKEISVPSAGWTDEKAFHPEEKYQEEPFAPTPPAREPEDEYFWDHDEIGDHTVAAKPMLEGKARQKKGYESGTETLMKSEAAPDESSAEKGLFFRNAEAPAGAAKRAPEPVGETTMDRLEMKKPEAVAVARPITDPSLVLSLAVEDVDFAREDIEGIISKMDGALVERDEQPENVIMAELASEKVDGLLDELGSIGEIRSQSLMEAGEKVIVRIELLEEPTPSP